MNKRMTHITDRNYFVSSLFAISFMVMVLSSLILALKTLQGGWVWNHATLNFAANASGTYLLYSVLFVCLTGCFQSFFTTIISFCDLSAIICFVVFLHVFSLVVFIALLTKRLYSLFRLFSFMKFNQGFNLFAFSTLFCYGWFRHGFFLIKKLCLEPDTAHTVPAWFIVSNQRGGVK